MNEDAGLERIAVIWSPAAGAELRAIEREATMQILYCADLTSGHGTATSKTLKPPQTGFRLRCGDYRVFFDFKGPMTIEITGVRIRKQAYR